MWGYDSLPERGEKTRVRKTGGGDWISVKGNGRAPGPISAFLLGRIGMEGTDTGH